MLTKMPAILIEGFKVKKRIFKYIIYLKKNWKLSSPKKQKPLKTTRSRVEDYVDAAVKQIVQLHLGAPDG